MRRLARVLLVLVFAAAATAQQTRIASDFEIAQMEKQAAHESEFTAQLSAHLNLGDLRAARNEIALARREFREALNIAETERAFARRTGDAKRYATATMYAGFACSRMDQTQQAFAMLEEAIRYAADDDRIWNLYAGAMNDLRMPQKAVSAARSAVAVGERQLALKATPEHIVDLGIDRLTLAIALSELQRNDESIALLEETLASLKSKELNGVRRQIAKQEAFEVYSTTRSDAAAYIALTNRTGLKLGQMYESRGDRNAARRAYEAVLAARSDDPTALAAMARLAEKPADAARAFADAFDANPFSFDIITDYNQWLQNGGKDDVTENASTPGAMMRLALNQMHRGEMQHARVMLDALIAKYPNNDVVNYFAAKNDLAMGDLARARSRTIQSEKLRNSLSLQITADALNAPRVPAFLTTSATSATATADDLRATLTLLARNALTPEQRVALDRVELTSVVQFDAGPASPPNQTIFEVGRAGNVALKFAQPTAFNGTFAANVPLRLTCHILGVTDLAGAQALLVEPLKLEPAP